MSTGRSPVPGLAVFDLDGTITRSDSLGPYVLGFIKGRPSRMLGLLRVLPMVARYALALANEGELKSAFIKSTLGGATRAEIDLRTAAFVPQLLAHGLFKAALDQIAEHRSQGAYLVLMSASTDLYVPAIAVSWASTKPSAPASAGTANGSPALSRHRIGAAKRKLVAFASCANSTPGQATAAYGNAASDIPHLRLADHGVLVNGSSGARSVAARDGIRCVDWR